MSRSQQINFDTKQGIVIPYFSSTAKRTAYIPDVGEIIYDAQLGLPFVGDGSTAGGKVSSALISNSVVAPYFPGIEFEVTGTLTAAAAATPVVLLADSLVPAGQKVYITRWFISVSGATAWADAAGTIVVIEDTAAVVAITIAKAGLTSKAMLVMGSANTTYADLIPAQSGLTAAKGIQVVADHTFGAGSDLKVTVSGYIK